MSNKNYKNDNESFMEGIYGCMERIEAGIIELQKAKTSAANPIVRNEDNTALVQEIKTAVDSCNKERLEETNAKLTKFIKAIFNDYARIFNQMDVLIKKEHPDFEGVKQQLAEAIDKMDEIKVKHNIDEKRHSFALYTKEFWILLSMIIILMAAGASAIYHLSRPNVQRDDDSLKYRYIKMKGDASAEQIATLEDILNSTETTKRLSRCEKMWRHTRRQSASKPLLPSKQGSKNRLQRNRRAKPSPLRTSRIIVRLNKINQNPDCNMATVKIKFRPSTVDGGQGSIFYQVIHNRIARQQKTGYRLYGYEWNNHLSEVVLPRFNDDRKRYLAEISDKIRMDVKALQKIISGFEHSGCDYTADDVIAEFIADNPENYLFSFMEGVISNLKTLGKIRTSETYAATLSSFRRFREDKDLALDDMDSDMMMAYEAYLKRSGVSPNSSSFYMRNLRAVYNRAVEKELTTQRFPFKHVYTGVEKTVKRAVPLKTVKRIKEMDLSMNPTLDFARDMFLFSFYTRGMSFVDMACLRKKDLNGNILSYRRRKTGQQLFIKWEKCMQEIVEKYDNPLSQYLLPIIKPFSEIDERKQYIYTAHNINRSLKIIGNQLGLSVPLTMYVSRHAWASIAKSKNVPISVISEGMGHDSEATTRIYLASLDTMAIDKANSMILKSL